MYQLSLPRLLRVDPSMLFQGDKIQMLMSWWSSVGDKNQRTQGKQVGRGWRHSLSTLSCDYKFQKDGAGEGGSCLAKDVGDSGERGLANRSASKLSCRDFWF